MIYDNPTNTYQHINLIIVVSLHSINYDSTMLLRLHFGPAIEFHHISYELLYDVLVVHMFHHMSYQVYKLYDVF